MKSSSYANGSNLAVLYTPEEAEALNAGLRLLAKFIASAIRRRREGQIAGKKRDAQ